MPRNIKIEIDPKRRFGAMARPGNIVFGTQTHLITKPQNKPTLNLLIEEARKKAKTAKQKRIAAERKGENTIRARIARLRHLEAVEELHQNHRIEALKEYKNLQRILKGKNTTNPREFIEERNAIHTLTQRVRFIEDLIDKTKSQAEKEKKELTQILSTPAAPEKKQTVKRRIKRKKIQLTEEQRTEVNGLLDSLSNAKRRAKEISNKIASTPSRNINEIEKLLRQLKEANIDLEYLPWLLEKATKETNPNDRITTARKREETALREYNLAAKILKSSHPEVREMRIDYLHTKRSRLYEEGRKVKQGTKERAKIDSQLREIEKQIAKNEKEKARE